MTEQEHPILASSGHDGPWYERTWEPRASRKDSGVLPSFQERDWHFDPLVAPLLSDLRRIDEQVHQQFVGGSTCYLPCQGDGTPLPFFDCPAALHDNYVDTQNRTGEALLHYRQERFILAGEIRKGRWPWGLFALRGDKWRVVPKYSASLDAVLPLMDKLERPSVTGLRLERGSHGRWYVMLSATGRFLWKDGSGMSAPAAICNALLATGAQVNTGE